jgi:hypothetical protein
MGDAERVGRTTEAGEFRRPYGETDDALDESLNHAPRRPAG